ncbi:MAG: tetratricopeptide repeat protein, partial [Akkermansia sp.]|nr:tetratricopeptide repeat protein [Akkermansia sp.]
MNHAPLITSKSTMLLAAIALTCPFAQAQAGTAGYLSPTTAAGTSEVGPTAVYSSTQQSINLRETARRQAMQQEAQQLLQEGRDAYKAGKYSIALEKFKAAWNRIPKAPATLVLQEHIVDVIGDASIAVANEYAKVGRYDDAEQLLLDVLSRNPNNERARRDLSMLRDPVRNNPALTPQHVRDVEEVNRLLTLGYGYYDLGKYDDAYSTFAQVIKIDPYNKAARAGQEAVSKRRINYYEGARNAFRAKALAEVDALWEEHEPQDLPDIEMGGGEVATAVSERQIANDQNLAKMQISSVNFEDTPIEDALDFLRGEARKNGVQLNFIFERPQVAKAAPVQTEVDEEGEEASEPVAVAQPVQEAVVPGLKVQDVNAKELLQMICAQAGCQYRVEDTGIVVYQTGAGVERMFKRQWKVARDFFEGGS